MDRSVSVAPSCSAPFICSAPLPQFSSIRGNSCISHSPQTLINSTCWSRNEQKHRQRCLWWTKGETTPPVLRRPFSIAFFFSPPELKPNWLVSVVRRSSSVIQTSVKSDSGHYLAQMRSGRIVGNMCRRIKIDRSIIQVVTHRAGKEKSPFSLILWSFQGKFFLL